MSLASGLLYVYTKPANSLGLDAWYFTAIDVPTGRTVFSKLTGVGTQFNNHYAAIYLGPDGSAYVATLVACCASATLHRVSSPHWLAYSS